MANTIFWLVAALTTLMAVGAGIAIGYHIRTIYTSLMGLRKWQDEFDKESEEIPQVITAKTPQEVKRTGDLDDDSAIVIAKTPAQLRREKEQRDARGDDELLEKVHKYEKERGRQ